MRASRTWGLVAPALIAGGCLGTEDTGRSPGAPIGPSSEPGPGWVCPDVAYGDGECDCGCGADDRDCGLWGCTTPGCMDVGCDNCFSDGQFWPHCRVPDGRVSPFLWQCASVDYGDGEICDCGCGSDDPDCEGRGCATPECTAAGCDVFWGEDEYGFPVDRGRPEAWTCPEPVHGDGMYCDCGCGSSDPDCSGLGCTAAGCTADACQFCWNGGSMVRCHSPPQEWGCFEGFYTDGMDCDCGCGVDDPDCIGLGCASPGCTADACDYCSSGDSRAACAHSEVLPAGWVCIDEFYGDGGCDCGCGAEDVDCGDGDDCTTPGCWAEGCEFSW